MKIYLNLSKLRIANRRLVLSDMVYLKSNAGLAKTYDFNNDGQ